MPTLTGNCKLVLQMYRTPFFEKVGAVLEKKYKGSKSNNFFVKFVKYKLCAKVTNQPGYIF